MLKGKIIELGSDGSALIKAKLPLVQAVHRKVNEVYIDLIDSRPLSDRQRRMCYALIHAIAEWSGSNEEEIKQAFKLDFWAEQVDTLADKIFSLSNAPMSLVAEFQRFLVRFIISNGVPVKRPLREYVDDVRDYTYMCLIHKKCAVCGRRADLHHIDAVGMGNDRNEVKHLGREVMSLCREHHTEIHTLGKAEFMEKYHLNGGIEADGTILKIYGLKR
ncbi:MAG: putative HNHc nuclease [Clostridia bacterium]|nr:putative HNHc nuclease [Clostridia bacterium]